MACVALFALGFLAPPAAAYAQVLVGGSQPVLRSNRVEGFGPDAQLVGGLGFGFEGRLNNYFLARGRLGALYATAPWIANLGLSVEVGALAGLGWGGEVELSRGGTLFATAGLSRIDGSRWMMHAGLGFTIFGLEWQHVFDGPNPHNALLFEVRLPLGLWWLQKRQEKAEQYTAAPAHTPQIKPRIGQRPVRAAGASGRTTQQPPAAERSAPAEPGAPAADGGQSQSGSQNQSGSQSQSGSQNQSGSQSQSQRNVTAADVAKRDAEFASRIAEADAARTQGDRLAEAIALSRAYTLRPDATVALRLSAAQLALGKPRAALVDFQRIGNVTQLPAAERESAEQLQRQLLAMLCHLRLELTGNTAVSDVVWIDGAVEPTATQGYDVPLDPGVHTLQVRRGEQVLAEREFQTKDGELLRLRVEVAPN